MTVESWSNERIRWHPGERKEFVVYMTIIEIRPHRWGWKVFEAQGIEPVFPEKRQAINYAQEGAWFRSGEIRILDSSGYVERVIPFDETERKL